MCIAHQNKNNVYLIHVTNNQLARLTWNVRCLFVSNVFVAPYNVIFERYNIFVVCIRYIIYCNIFVLNNNMGTSSGSAAKENIDRKKEQTVVYQILKSKWIAKHCLAHVMLTQVPLVKSGLDLQDPCFCSVLPNDTLKAVRSKVAKCQCILCILKKYMFIKRISFLPHKYLQ